MSKKGTFLFPGRPEIPSVNPLIDGSQRHNSSTQDVACQMDDFSRMNDDELDEALARERTRYQLHANNFTKLCDICRKTLDNK